MHFINAKLKSENGEVIAASLDGHVTLPKRETENRWGGVFEMSVQEAMKLLNRSDGNFELDIPGVLKGKIILKNANGDFLGTVASFKLARASSMVSPCVVVPVSGLKATNPPSGAAVKTAVNQQCIRALQQLGFVQVRQRDSHSRDAFWQPRLRRSLAS